VARGSDGTGLDSSSPDDRSDRSTGVGRVLGTVGLIAVAVACMWLLSSCTAAPIGIDGTVTMDGVTRPGVEIAVFAVPPAPATTADVGAPVATTATDDAGHFVVRPVPAGHYWVRLGGTMWDDGTNHGGATPAEIVVGPRSATITSDIPAVTGGLTGIVRRTGTGLPLPGVSVDALSAAGQRDVTVASATTDGNGRYAFAPDALPIGQYLVRLSGSTYLTRYAPDAGAPTEATTFPVANASTTANANGSVDTPRSVTARITNGHLPIAGAVVTLYREDGRLLTSATTGADGRFSFTNLSAARYRAHVVPPAPYRAEAWGTRSDPDVMHSTLINLLPLTATPWDSGDNVVAVCDPVTFAPASVHSGEDLTGADLRGCDLTGATFTNATLTGARVAGTNVASAVFAGADLRNVRSGGMTGLPQSLPTSFQVRQGWLLGPQVDLSDEEIGAISVGDVSLAGADLRRADMSGASMTSCDLSGVDATNADFSRTTFMAGCTFSGAKFAGATFTAAAVLSTNATAIDLTDAHLATSRWTGSTLSGATFTRTDLTKVDFGSVTITGATLADATMTGLRSGRVVGIPASMPPMWIVANGNLVGPAADLHYADLFATDLRLASLVGTSFYGASVTGANLVGVDATGADFSYANLGQSDVRSANVSSATFFAAGLWRNDLTGTDFAGANLSGIRSGEVGGTPLHLPAPWQLRAGTLMGPGVDLSSRDLTGLDLSDLDLTGANLAGSNPGNSPGAKLDSTNLSRTKLADADLRNATLPGATVEGITLVGAKLTGVRSGGTTGVPASLPVDWRFVAGHLVGPGAVLWNANLAGANLAGANLSRADLSSAILDSADLSGANLDSANLMHTSLASADLAHASLRYAALTEVTLSSASLVGADLTGARLVNATMPGADLSGATLEGVGSSGISGAPVGMPPGWRATGGSLIGPSAYLRGSNIAGADLEGLSLANATIDNVASGGVTGTPSALPSGWRLTVGYLVGPTAYLQGADLRNADLSNLDLTYVALYDANIRGAGIAGTRLGSSLSGLRSGALTGTPALLQPGYRITKGYLLGDYVDLSNEDLTGVDATGASMIETRFQGSKLAGATFLGATGGGRASGAIYSAASPTTCPDGVKAPTQAPTCIGHGLYPTATG